MVQLIFQLALVSVFLLMGAAPWALSECTNTCGNLTDIPFPFGIGPKSCFLDEWYEIECRPQKGNVLVPFLKRIYIEVLNISLVEPRLNSSVIKVMIPWTVNWDGQSFLKGSPFYVDSFLNGFFVVGCNTTVMVENTETGRFSGCRSKCQSDTEGNSIRYINCSSGINCCSSFLPLSLQNISVRILKDKEDVSAAIGEARSYAFIYGYDSSFDFEFFDRIDLHAIRTRDKFPVVLNWGVVKDLSITNPNNTSASHMYCQGIGPYVPSYDEQYQETKQTGHVNCVCVDGYEGNPYVENGCKDVDECKNGQSVCDTGTCVNRPGHYDCVVNQKMRFVTIGLGTGLGFLVFILFLWWIYKIAKKRKERKLKEKYFKRNGGLLLQQQLHSINNNVEKIKFFYSRELETATSHFDVNRILGQGGEGTVYKGILQNGEIVAIKKSNVIDVEQVEQFINEIMILSQLNHRNIVKLLGCCLETKIPLLVYEFIPNGTLYDHVHTSNEENPISWEMRLQIAIDVANALSYMHFTILVPIYHRDIKSSNILLDERYRAKIADFGISRLVSLEQTHLTTLVQGTFGYLDPEYFQSSQYTDKSDVYSFGIVLVELLTGQKPISSLTERQGRSLATYFAHSIEDNLLLEIIDPYISNQVEIEEISKVGNLAYKCLNLTGNKRPTMKEVKIELEAIKKCEDFSIEVTKEKIVDEEIESFDANSLSSSNREDVDQSSDVRLLTRSHTC